MSCSWKGGIHIIKTLSKSSTEGTYLEVIKAIYDKPTANIILNGQNWKYFHENWHKARMPSLTTSIQHSIGSPGAIRQDKKIKGTQLRKEEVKLSSTCRQHYSISRKLHSLSPKPPPDDNNFRKVP